MADPIEPMAETAFQLITFGASVETHIGANAALTWCP
jgi:hypothetical protein